MRENRRYFENEWGWGMRNSLRNLLILGASASICLGSTVPVTAATPPSAMVMAWNIDAISSLDPGQAADAVSAEIIQNMCDRLVDFDPANENKLIPGLAETWTVAPDGKSISFQLRDGLKFPSGKIATARDMAWSLQRVVKLGFGAAAALTDYGFTKANVDSLITAPDDKTLVMTFDRAYPSNMVLQAIAAFYVSALVDRETVTENEVNGDFSVKSLAIPTTSSTVTTSSPKIPRPVEGKRYENSSR
jgi:peptide/nickel transport system substrate-binding protein